MSQRETLKSQLKAKSGKKREESAELPEPSASGYVPAPSRRGKVLLAVYVDLAVREQIRREALRQHTTAQALVLRYLNEGFVRDGEKPIA